MTELRRQETKDNGGKLLTTRILAVIDQVLDGVKEQTMNVPLQPRSFLRNRFPCIMAVCRYSVSLAFSWKGVGQPWHVNGKVRLVLSVSLQNNLFGMGKIVSPIAE